MQADHFQHAGMQMRRMFRGGAMIHLHQKQDEPIEPFCSLHLNMQKATPFAVMSGTYLVHQQYH
jgi:hypothetical protein